MSRAYDFHIAQLEEPTIHVIHETRALHHGHHDIVIDEAREAYYRQTQDWQWQEEMAKREDERISAQYEKESGETVPCEQCGDWYWGPDPGAGDGLCPICYDNKNPSI